MRDMFDLEECSLVPLAHEIVIVDNHVGFFLTLWADESKLKEQLSSSPFL